MKLRRILGVVVTAAVAMSLFTVSPASAAPTGATVWVAHGIPGAKVDVCVNGSEALSKFRYGQKARLAGVPAGTYTIKVFLAHKGSCKGTLVIKQKVTLTDGLNATAVARIVKGEPKLSIFVNDLTIANTANASVTVRHTAKAPAVDVWVNGGTLVKNFTQGSEAGPVEVPGDAVYAYWVSQVGDWAPVIGPGVSMLEAGRAYQILAVGTQPSNYRFIVIGQAGR